LPLAICICICICCLRRPETQQGTPPAKSEKRQGLGPPPGARSPSPSPRPLGANGFVAVAGRRGGKWQVTSGLARQADLRGLGIGGGGAAVTRGLSGPDSKRRKSPVGISCTRFWNWQFGFRPGRTALLRRAASSQADVKSKNGRWGVRGRCSALNWQCIEAVRFGNFGFRRSRTEDDRDGDVWQASSAVALQGSSQLIKKKGAPSTAYPRPPGVQRQRSQILTSASGDAIWGAHRPNYIRGQFGGIFLSPRYPRPPRAPPGGIAPNGLPASRILRAARASPPSATSKRRPGGR
jgi:hypothetical protein